MVAIQSDSRSLLELSEIADLTVKEQLQTISDNKTYHSHSMINEPCVQNHFYLDALAIVAAESLEEALSKLAEQNAPNG